MLHLTFFQVEVRNGLFSTLKWNKVSQIQEYVEKLLSDAKKNVQTDRDGVFIVDDSSDLVSRFTSILGGEVCDSKEAERNDFSVFYLCCTEKMVRSSSLERIRWIHYSF